MPAKIQVCKKSDKWNSIGLIIILGVFLVEKAFTQIHAKIIFRNLNEHVRGISIRNDSTLFFVTASGMIGKMPMSGQNFDSLYASPYGLADVDFFSDSLGFACGEFGKLLKTTDGGISWQSVNLSVSQVFTDIELQRSGFGILAGQNGKLFFTHNFGATWIDRSKPILGPVNRTYFIDSTKIIIHSGNGKIFQYDPQTDSLSTLTVPIYVDEFTVDRNGFGSASSNLINTTIYRTIDFGATWTPTNGSTYTNSRFSEAISYKGKQWFVGGPSMQQSVDNGQSFQLFENDNEPLRKFGYYIGEESIANYDTLAGDIYICGKNGAIAKISSADMSFSAVSGGYENTVIDAFQEPGKLVVFTAKSVFSKGSNDSIWKRNRYFFELGSNRIISNCVGKVSEGNYAFSGYKTILNYSSTSNQLYLLALPYTFTIADFIATGNHLYAFGISSVFNSTLPDKCILRFSVFPSFPYDIDCFPQHTYFTFGKDGNGFKLYGSTPSIQKAKNWGNNIYPLISQGSSIWGQSAIALDSNRCIFYNYENNVLKRTDDQFMTQYPILQFLAEDNFHLMKIFDSTLIVLTTQGRIYRSLDTGKIWQLFETEFLFSNPGPFTLSSPNTLVVQTSVGLAEIDMGIWLSKNITIKHADTPILAFPNPFSDVLNVHVNQPVQQMDLLDLSGRVVMRNLEKEFNGSIRFGHLASGLYFLKVVTQNQVLTTKLYRK